MYWKSSSEEEVISRTVKVLDSLGYETALNVALTPASSGKSTMVDVLGQDEEGDLVVIEVKTSPSSGAALSNFFQTASALKSDQRGRRTMAILVTSEPLSRTVLMAADEAGVRVLSTDKLEEELKDMLWRQRL